MSNIIERDGEKIGIESCECQEAKEIPTDFSHQILLYAKSWYKKSGNILEDLKILAAEYSGCTIEVISDGYIRNALVTCFMKYAPEYNKDIAVAEALGWGPWAGTACDRTPEEVMLGQLSIAKGKYVDPEQKLNVLVKDKAAE